MLYSGSPSADRNNSISFINKAFTLGRVPHLSITSSIRSVPYANPWVYVSAFSQLAELPTGFPIRQNADNHQVT